MVSCKWNGLNTSAFRNHLIFDLYNSIKLSEWNQFNWCFEANVTWTNGRHLPLIRGAKMNQGAKMNCCDRAIFLTEMVKLTWNAEKHKICWKACFVVTCLFFWWKWRNLHEMLRSTKSAEKHVLLWHVYFFDGNGETYMKCWEAQNLLKSMFCCDMSNLF